MMVSVAEARGIIDRYLPDPRKCTSVPIRDALGYALASDVIARYAIPNFAQSSMDGYAIRHEEAEKELVVVDKIPAGTTVQKILLKGQAMRIFTGAPLPLGADTVVMQEKVQVTVNGSIGILDRELRRGDNVRPKGSEVDEGTRAIQSESVLTPAALGYLAQIGCSHVDIYAAPRVAIILTGNELKPPGEVPGFGEVYESNSFQLRGALTQSGIMEIKIFHVYDDLGQLTAAMGSALADADVLLLVGGVSVGEYDYVTAAAKKCGVTQRFHGVRQKPGKPLFFGTKQEKPVFGLPGNPSSALTCFYLYVAPALEKIMRMPTCIKKIKARMSHDYRKNVGLTHFLKGSYDGESVTPLHAQESYRLQSFAQANCLIILPEEDDTFLAGDDIEAYLL